MDAESAPGAFVVLVDISGSMKSVPKAVLSASLYRLVSFLSKRLAPIVLLAYRHTVTWVDFGERRTRAVQTARYEPRHVGADRMVCATPSPPPPSRTHFPHFGRRQRSGFPPGPAPILQPARDGSVVW